MKLSGQIFDATFLSRPNRFLTIARVGTVKKKCFLPNPGRLQELLVPGKEVLLRKVEKEDRSTGYDLAGVMHEGRIVSVDARLPNKLVLEALKLRKLWEFAQYTSIKPEYAYGSSKFDFLLANSEEKCILEVKSVTLVKNGVAEFPDAVTERGRRHVLELIKSRLEGYRPCVLFVVQRDDAKCFRPNYETDPRFADALLRAGEGGVEVYAWKVNKITDISNIELDGRIPVSLRGHGSVQGLKVQG